MLGLRVGSEKEPDNDVVGVTSLYKKSIIIKSNNKIDIDFLGKDSLRYYRKDIDIDKNVY